MRGRPRLKGARRIKSGKYQGQSKGMPEQIHPETIAVRNRELERDGLVVAFAKNEGGRAVIKRTADDRLSGFTLGRLLLRYRQDKSNPSSISDVQFEAGEAWHRIVRQHAMIHGYQLSVRSPSFVMVGGRGEGSLPDGETIARVKKQFQGCYDAIMESCKDHGLQLRNILYGVVVENWPASCLSHEDYGLLREGLNALARVLR